MTELLIPLKGKWEGWVCGDWYLTDTAGNNYTPQNLIDSYYGKQVWRNQVGYAHNIVMLKSRLEELIASYEEKIKHIEPHYNFIRYAENYLLRNDNHG